MYLALAFVRFAGPGLAAILLRFDHQHVGFRQPFHSISCHALELLSQFTPHYMLESSKVSSGPRDSGVGKLQHTLKFATHSRSDICSGFCWTRCLLQVRSAFIHGFATHAKYAFLSLELCLIASETVKITGSIVSYSILTLNIFKNIFSRFGSRKAHFFRNHKKILFPENISKNCCFVFD